MFVATSEEQINSSAPYIRIMAANGRFVCGLQLITQDACEALLYRVGKRGWGSKRSDGQFLLKLCVNGRQTGMLYSANSDGLVQLLGHYGVKWADLKAFSLSSEGAVPSNVIDLRTWRSRSGQGHATVRSGT